MRMLHGMLMVMLLPSCGAGSSGAGQSANSNRGSAQQAALSPTQAPLPETPGRREVVDAMQAITPAVQACGRIQHGQAQVRFDFDGPTGALISAVVIDSGAGTPLAACIENAVRGAHVPPFRRATFLVNYPFRL